MPDKLIMEYERGENLERDIEEYPEEESAGARLYRSSITISYSSKKIIEEIRIAIITKSPVISKGELRRAFNGANIIDIDFLEHKGATLGYEINEPIDLDELGRLFDGIWYLYLNKNGQDWYYTSLDGLMWRPTFKRFSI